MSSPEQQEQQFFYEMPKKNEVESMKEINGFFKEKNYNTLVVAWTAFDDKKSMNECREAGMVDFLGKPFTVEQLKKILIKWYEKLRK